MYSFGRACHIDVPRHPWANQREFEKQETSMRVFHVSVALRFREQNGACNRVPEFDS
jgi:hypothetical protein